MLAVAAVAGFALLAPAAVGADDDPAPTRTADNPGLPPAASAAAAAMREARERRLRDQQRAVEGRLRDEHRAVEGRIRTLDRQLEPWEREQRQPRIVEPNGLPRPLQDPVAERLNLDRRGLRDRDRLLEQQMRDEQIDRERISRIRKW